jgi:hypothetical protein
MLSRPRDYDGLRSLTALKISETEICDKDRNSEGDDRDGKTPGETLFCTN